jgi:hypothetical protein
MIHYDSQRFLVIAGYRHCGSDISRTCRRVQGHGVVAEGGSQLGEMDDEDYYLGRGGLASNLECGIGLLRSRSSLWRCNRSNGAIVRVHSSRNSYRWATMNVRSPRYV